MSLLGKDDATTTRGRQRPKYRTLFKLVAITLDQYNEARTHEERGPRKKATGVKNLPSFARIRMMLVYGYWGLKWPCSVRALSQENAQCARCLVLLSFCPVLVRQGCNLTGVSKCRALQSLSSPSFAHCRVLNKHGNELTACQPIRVLEHVQILYTLSSHMSHYEQLICYTNITPSPASQKAQPVQLTY